MKCSWLALCALLQRPYELALACSTVPLLTHSLTHSHSAIVALQVHPLVVDAAHESCHSASRDNGTTVWHDMDRRAT